MTATLPTSTSASEVARLRSTFATGRTRDVAWRLAQLEGVERMVAEREDDFAIALAADLGRPRVDAWLADLAPTTAESAFARKHLKRWMRSKRAGLPLSVQPGSARYVYEPLGTVLIIGPWNYPVYLTLTPLVAALAAGNCAVVKPSEHAPAVAALLADLLPRYVDRDAVAVVTGGPEETQDLLAQGLDHAFFTGSPEVGALIMAAAAPTLTPVTLELGGKSPVIVTGDADIAVAAKRIAWTKLMNSGQTCIAPDYVLVEESVRDTLVAGIAEATRELRGGAEDGLRIVNARQAARIAGLLDDHGGRIAYGGAVDVEALTGQPTIVVDPRPDSPLMTEEIFGPILPVLTVEDLDTAIRFVNDRPKPLAVYLFSRSKGVAKRVTAEISSGGTVINHLMFHVLVPQLPFGGVGRSGMGAYHGRWGFETFSHRKSVLTKPTRPDLSLIYPPYTAKAEKLLRRFF
ncbi:aldehyde dehydrogenase family protein [Pseudonocardia sp. 73-21]|jgi:aldehyde dehydrogenase (NAD+)|uniref:aldehyde dehydrogenase family protein n=1 Tax=Pseudonocardia sp. 73-21 TaxID=1895809 RepID=UPI00095D253E|nr:aldehyde dehydrogenase family protein [Pseudonocardia sp. 73-21]OJY39854.1 MAG: aldehyde dehydrogenase family protein [Pseudonocardia sp. 73-21]